MENYDILINEINTMLDSAESISDSRQRFEYLKNNCESFESFIDSITLILMQYHFSKKSDVLNNLVSRLLALDGFFESIPHLQYFKSNLLDALDRSENKFAFNLQYEKDFSKVELAIAHAQYRSELISVLRSNNFFEGQALNENSAKQYASYKYEQNMYGHALIQLKENFLTLPKEKVIELIRLIDKTPFWQELISKDSRSMNFYEKIYSFNIVILF